MDSDEAEHVGGFLNTRRGVDTQGEVDTPYEVVAPWGVEFLWHDESASLMLFFISGSRHKNSVIDMDNKKIFIKIQSLKRSTFPLER